MTLSPNSFEDDDDWLGLVSQQIQDQQFLTVDEGGTIYETQTVVKIIDKQFPTLKQIAP